MKEVAMTLRSFVAAGLALAMAALLVSTPAIAAGKPAPTAKVNINTATVEQLTTLPGVGPKLAARVIEYRQKTPFRSTQELMNVKGIGEKNFAKIEAWLTVGEAPKGASK
jgi:competence protein ComEA